MIFLISRLFYGIADFRKIKTLDNKKLSYLWSCINPFVNNSISLFLFVIIVETIIEFTLFILIRG
jgi:hypothetical protein